MGHCISVPQTGIDHRGLHSFPHQPLVFIQALFFCTTLQDYVVRDITAGSRGAAAPWRVAQ